MIPKKTQAATPVKKRILLVEKHPVIRGGLGQLINQEIGLEVCGEAATAKQGLQLLRKTKPDLAIVAITLADRDGLDLTKEICAKFPEVPVLILSMFSEAAYAQRALRAGAMGYIMKDAPLGMILDAIHKVLNGGIWLSKDMLLRMRGAVRPAPAKGVAAPLVLPVLSARRQTHPT